MFIITTCFPNVYLVCSSQKLLSVSCRRCHFVKNLKGFAQQILKKKSKQNKAKKKSPVFPHKGSYIVKHGLQLIKIWKIKVPFTHVVRWFPHLKFTCRSYFNHRVKLLLFHASWKYFASRRKFFVSFIKKLREIENAIQYIYLGLMFIPSGRKRVIENFKRKAQKTWFSIQNSQQVQQIQTP